MTTYRICFSIDLHGASDAGILLSKDTVLPDGSVFEIEMHAPEESGLKTAHDIRTIEDGVVVVYYGPVTASTREARHQFLRFWEARGWKRNPTFS
jgi:hypothetical protein